VASRPERADAYRAQAHGIGLVGDTPDSSG